MPGLGAGRGRRGRRGPLPGPAADVPVEVIAVDDGSLDGSGALLDERAAGDPRLRVLHLTDNGGPGRARNEGLARASGAYVWFVDGDDRLAPGALAAVADGLSASGRNAGGPGARRHRPWHRRP